MKKLLLVLAAGILFSCADDCTECGERVLVMKNNTRYIYYCNKDLDPVPTKAECYCDCPEGEECGTVTINIEWPE